MLRTGVYMLEYLGRADTLSWESQPASKRARPLPSFALAKASLANVRGGELNGARIECLELRAGRLALHRHQPEQPYELTAASEPIRLVQATMRDGTRLVSPLFVPTHPAHLAATSAESALVSVGLGLVLRSTADCSHVAHLSTRRAGGWKDFLARRTSTWVL